MKGKNLIDYRHIKGINEFIKTNDRQKYLYKI